MEPKDIKRLSELSSKLAGLLDAAAQLKLISSFDWAVTEGSDKGATAFSMIPMVKSGAHPGAEIPTQFSPEVREHLNNTIKEMFPKIIQRALELADRRAKDSAVQLLKDARHELEKIELMTMRITGERK